MSTRSTGESIDPITFEIILNSLRATSTEMASVVAKTAYSTPVNEGRDFAATVYDRNGALIVVGDFDLPAFAGVMQFSVPEVIAAVGIENMNPGDMYMINDPYIASTHCNDIHFIKPFFVDGRLLAFGACTAHWADVGGVAPGSLNCRARSHFEEGVRIPPVTIYRRGELQKDLLDLIFVNIRNPSERLGDLNAQVAALKTGQARFEELVSKHGEEAVLATMDRAQSYSEVLVKKHLMNLPDGVYYAEDAVDQDVLTGEPKYIRLKLTINGDTAEFDFTESDGPAEGGINCTFPATTSAVVIALATVLPPFPMNGGVMRALSIVAEEGSLLWAKPPSPISGLAATSMECVIGCVMQALSQALPDRGIGSPFSLLNMVFSGLDPRSETNEPFLSYIWAFGGTGATISKDGASIVGSPYTASTQNIPIELQERRFPVAITRYMFLTDSGGAGRRRGGMGLDQVVEFLDCPGEVSCIGNRERFGPPGVFGGKSGGKARLVINPETPQERTLGVFATNEPVRRFERLSFWSAGGGGYGDPYQRPPAEVVEDVMDDYITIEGARESYGVVVEEVDARRLIYRVDEEETARLRSSVATSTISD